MHRPETTTGSKTVQSLTSDRIRQQRDLGLQHYQSGRLPEAEACFQQVLQSQPDDPTLWRLLGIVAIQQQHYSSAIERLNRAIELDPNAPNPYSTLGAVYLTQQKWPEAIECFQTTTRLQPSDASAHAKLGGAYQLQGKMAEAIAAYQQALQLQPDAHQIHINLGTVYLQAGNVDKAIASYHQALQLQPDLSSLHAKLGQIYQGQGSLGRAIASYQRALQLQPDFYQVHSNLGNAYQTQGKCEEAIASYHRSLQLQPEDPETLNNLGNAHLEQGNLDRAIDSYQQALRLKPDFYEVLNNLGNALRQQGKFEAAIASYRQALQLQPNDPETLTNLGTAYQLQRKFEEAIASYQQALQLQPDFYPAHSNLGNAFKGQGKFDEAIACYHQALQLQPDFHPALCNLGSAYQEQGNLTEAIASYERALQLRPDYPEVLKEYVWVRRGICSWDGLSALEQSLISASQSDRWAASPFPMLAIGDDSPMQLAAAKHFCRNAIGNSLSPLWTGQKYRHDKIRLAYLSGDYREHPVAYLIAELFELHDRSRFELVAISFGPDDRSPMRQRMERAFDRFIDVRQMSDLETAQLMRDLEIDIAIDLAGYTQHCRSQILAYRPAPIQVNYLGYPGTMGADFIDYILVDPFIVPPDQQPYFAEQLVHLPDCYQVNDSQRAIAARTPSRQDCGLPAEGFVFCSFNNSYKITPTLFGIWMRLLDAVPDSVLWLLGNNELVESNLRQAARARKVNPDRLVFAPRRPLPEHLARHRLADLFLDTLPYNAHTTASDALWVGLPVLTCAGQSFASRVAGSLLQAIGLPELVTHSLTDYEALALKLATQPDLLREINRKLAQNRLSTPLFDSDRFRCNIEAAYRQMRSIWQRGEQPRAFAVHPSTQIS